MFRMNMEYESQIVEQPGKGINSMLIIEASQKILVEVESYCHYIYKLKQCVLNQRKCTVVLTQYFNVFSHGRLIFVSIIAIVNLG